MIGFIKIALGIYRLLPMMWELVDQLEKRHAEDIALKTDNAFKKLGDAKDENQRVSALKDIQRVIAKS